MADVKLENCAFLLTSNAKIFSSSLKKLATVDGDYTVSEHKIFKLSIEAPALVCLRLGDDASDPLVDMTEPHTLPTLINASILLPWMNWIEQLNVLLMLSNVTTLHLLDFDVTVISSS